MHTLEQLRNGALAGSVRLQLSCGLTEFPREIFALADTLEILDLSGNALSSLPDDLPRLHKLRVIFCSNNAFTELPAVLGACLQLTMVGFKSCRIATVPPTALPPGLRWLILTDNCLSELPATIGACSELQKLMLAGNRLRALPSALADCSRLELLRIAANDFAALPAWLLDMPRLAWLAYAGNPFSSADESAAAERAHPLAIPFERLQLGRRLGEGASGVIDQALWSAASEQDAAPLPVAVKLFKGAITSDGLPRCELNACISAGDHPNLIAVLGEVSGHPQGTQGCVMALVEPSFTTLAGPPSLDSCTRDTYQAAQRFALPALLRLASGIAAAASHLHSRAILHGDLYAHNILHTSDGAALLGDFGAASPLGEEPQQALALQRLEVRAFGVLLGELLERCIDDAADTAPATLAVLAALSEVCMQDPAARPLFDEISRRLALLAEVTPPA